MPTSISLARCLAVAALAGLAACQPEGAEEKPVQPTASSEPEQATGAMRFAALSRTARAVTGDVAFMAAPRIGADDLPAMRIKSNTGVTYDTVLRPGGAEEAGAVDWEYVFGVPVVTEANPPPGTPNVELHTVTQELVPPSASAGGFCGAERTQVIALATGLTVDGERRMSIAAFRGEWPPKDASALCDVFSYTPPP
ncbi:MAG TPA: hypothetical protein VFV70_07925 [Hyphomonadaceae bacterium]|nr:hypothetical protein [Hyphomonadaceae bacterium]